MRDYIVSPVAGAEEERGGEIASRVAVRGVRFSCWVIAVILMVAITVVLAAAVYVWVSPGGVAW